MTRKQPNPPPPQPGSKPAPPSGPPRQLTDFRITGVSLIEKPFYKGEMITKLAHGKTVRISGLGLQDGEYEVVEETADSLTLRRKIPNAD